VKRFAVGLTGGIASGKSIASTYLKSHFSIIDADLIVHQIYEEDQKLMGAIAREFGKDCIRDSKIYRPALRDKVFSNPDRLRLLNSMVHPIVGERLKESITYARNHSSYHLFVIPLLFENQWEKELDYTLLIGCTREIQVRRIMERNGFSKERALEILATQMSEESKRELCNAVVMNDRDLHWLHSQLENWILSFFKEENSATGGFRSC